MAYNKGDIVTVKGKSNTAPATIDVTNMNISINRRGN